MGATPCRRIRSNRVKGMAQITDLPTAQFRVRTYQRISNVLDSLRKLKGGGTATDVRNSYLDTTGEQIAVSTVRSILFHLAEPSIGLASWQTDGSNARWWTAADVADPNTMPAPGNHGASDN